MKKIVLILLFSFAMTSLLLAAENPTEESLIKAWEQLQKSDPHTVTFEKIANHRYKFKTTLFPFDGELRVNDATIDDMEMGSYGFITGLLDIELIGLPKNVPQKYSHKYNRWALNNTLYYDKKAAKWLSPREFEGVITKMYAQKSKPSGCLLNYVFTAVLIIVLAIVTYLYRRVTKTALQRQADAIAQVKRSIELSKKGVKLSEETNTILKKILEALKNKE